MANITTEPLRDKRQLQALFVYLKGQDTRNYAMAKVQLNTALRLGDVVTLMYDDFFHYDGEFRRYVTLKEEKTKHERHIAINKSLRTLLSSYVKEYNLGPGDYLFPSRKGLNKPISKTQAHRIYQEAGKVLHLEKFNSHSLRKTWGYWAYRETHNIALIMQVYGHTSAVQTLKYIGITQQDKDCLYNKIQF